MTWRDALERARATGDRDVLKDVVVAARHDFVSVRAIAQLFNVSTSTVQRWAGGPTGHRSRSLDAPCSIDPTDFAPKEASAA